MSESKLRQVYEEEGGSIAAIADRLNTPVSTIRGRLRKLGLLGKGVGGPNTLSPPEDELRRLHAKYNGYYAGIAKDLGVSASAVSKWYTNIGIVGGSKATRYERTYPREIRHTLRDGFVVAFSDAHWWDSQKSRAHEALIAILKKLTPAIVIANGDLIDGARISRHDPSGIDSTPTFKDELEVAVRHAAEIKRVSSGAEAFWCWGNHDSRLARYLVRQAPELLEIAGARLDHHILGWQFCWSVRINDELLVMHRFRGGQHATFTNTLRSGMSIATGHLHSQRVYPFSDARGTRWGVDLGCLAEVHGPQFAYTEANPMEWRSGFAVFEFKAGKLLPPELVTVLDDGSVCWQKNQLVL